ncbi:MAG: nickel-responsive transcriptional regulator NikR [Phycisphaerae bacterium]|nr:nickel-responsive transcriptional regulator NikR [Phycisphaerae bacterium]
MSDLVRLSLSIEKPLFKQLEKMVTDGNYSNRSEFIRDMIRGRMVDEQWESGGEAIGTISLVFDHHARGLAAKLTHQQHHFPGTVMATTHIHLDKNLCAEMIMVKGKPTDIKKLTDALKREKGVLHAKLATGSTGKKLH